MLHILLLTPNNISEVGQLLSRRWALRLKVACKKPATEFVLTLKLGFSKICYIWDIQNCLGLKFLGFKVMEKSAVPFSPQAAS